MHSIVDLFSSSFYPLLFLTCKAPESSRKKQHQQQQQQGGHGRVGVRKIDLKGAQDQALKAFFNEDEGLL